MKYKILKRPWGFEYIVCDKRSGKDDINISFTSSKKLSDDDRDKRIAEEITQFKDNEIAERDRLNAEKVAAKLVARQEKKEFVESFQKSNPSGTLTQFINAIDSGAIGD